MGGGWEGLYGRPPLRPLCSNRPRLRRGECGREVAGRAFMDAVWGTVWPVGGVVPRAGPFLSDAGDHKGPHSAPLHSRPYRGKGLT